MIRPVRALCISLAVLASSLPAAAQIIQPTYVRPSKGASIKIWDGSLSLIKTFHQSAVYEWVPFSGMQFTAVFNSGECKYFPIITVQSQPLSTWTAGTTYIEPDRNATHLARPVIPVAGTPDNDIWTTRSDATYVYVMITKQSSTPAAAECNLTLYMTPLPFAPIEGANGIMSIGNVVLNDATATLVTAAYRWNRALTVQNQGTNIVYCGPTTATTSSVFAFSLIAGGAAKDGSGGSATLDGFNGRLYCITSAGAGLVSTMSW